MIRASHSHPERFTMKISTGSIVTLAATGAPVEAHITFTDGSEAVSPVVAWATVVSYHDEEDGQTDTRISPIVIHDGGAWDEADLKENYTVDKLILRPVVPSPSS